MKPLSASIAEIISVGDELLKGSTLNTNAQFLGKMLRDDGFTVRRQVSCPDTLPDIRHCLHEALKRADFILLSGGLGPTPDDVTRDAIAEYFASPLVFSKTQYSWIRKIYRKHQRKIPAMVRKEAMFPGISKPLLNRFGLALGFVIRSGTKVIVALPGVPRELENMYQDAVRPEIRKWFPSLKVRPRLVVRTAGLSEPEVMERLRKDFFDEPFSFGIYPAPGEVAVRIDAEKNTTISNLRKKIAQRLKGYIYSWTEESLAQIVARLLSQKGQTVAVAESCSGGLLSAALTEIPGASRYFLGGLVAYSNAVKEQLLGVASTTLKKCGAVSEQTAIEMAVQARNCFGADFGLAITGIAGPSGGSRLKPVGEVFLAISSRRKTKVVKRLFWGTRKQIQARSVQKALELLWREIEGK